jgi:predicted metal-dependent peptidase
MSFDLKLHAYRLLIEEPFFAALSRKIEKKENYGIPTAGVRVNPDSGHFEMAYNPDFFEKLSDVEKAGVLKHEFYHLIFDHVTTRKPEGVPHQKWNIAADLAINSHLVGELPEQCCMPGEGPFAELPKGESAEWYLANLPEDDESEGQQGDGEGGEGEPSDGDGDDSGGQDNNNDNGNGPSSSKPGNFDDHSGWDEAASSEANQMAKERLKNAIKEAAQEAAQSAKGWGSVSGEVRKEIMKRLETKVDWRKVLRYFIKTSQRANRSSTIKRINRRYAYIHPGKKVRRQAKIAIAIDQSGSVSDEMLAAFFAELNNLAKLAEFTVVPFDTQVDESKVYVWKKGKSQKPERVLCGGTCFEAPTDWANNNNVDGLIILTDMEAPKPKACKAQRMWLTDARGASRPYFQTNERVIAVD